MKGINNPSLCHCLAAGSKLSRVQERARAAFTEWSVGDEFLLDLN